MRGQDLNLRPPGYEPDELPAALPREILVPETGVEPARDCSHGILSPGRLPIPPLRRGIYFSIRWKNRQLKIAAYFLPRAHRISGRLFFGGISMEPKMLNFPNPYSRALPQGDLDDLIFTLSEEPQISDR